MASGRLSFVTPVMLGALALCAVAPVACFPDPAGDFKDYTDNTAPFRVVTPKDAGPATDSAPPTVAEEGLYYGACLSTLAAGRIDRVLRFYTETKFTPDPAGGTGKLTVKFTSMKLGPSNGPPVSVSKSETVGMTYTVETTTDSKGLYAAALGTVNVPGASNPISQRDIVVEETSLPGKFARDKFCSQLIGHVTVPTDIRLAGEDNTCVYIKVKEGDPTPVLKPDRSDFPASCVLQ